MKPPLSKSFLRTTVLRQYKELLIQSKQLFDINARQFVGNRIRARFRDNIFEQGAKRVDSLLYKGWKYLRLLKKANLGDVKAMDKVLNNTYGRVGKRKHQLLEPYFAIKQANETTTPSNEQSSSEHPPIPFPSRRKNPPVIPAPIKALMNRDNEVNAKFVFENPPVYAKLSKSREINAMRKHYARQLKKLRAPLPLSEVQHIQTCATAQGPVAGKTKKQIKLEEEMKQVRLRSGRFQGAFNKFSARFLRRRYQSLLKEYIPMISQAEEGKWRVDQAQLSSVNSFPVVQARHLNGPVINGIKVGGVDAKGAYINPPTKECRIREE